MSVPASGAPAIRPAQPFGLLEAAKAKRRNLPVRVIMVVVDGGLGLGAIPDCRQVDIGCSTIANTAARFEEQNPGAFRLPHFAELGLGNAIEIVRGKQVINVSPHTSPLGAFGVIDPEGVTMTDTIVTHWGMQGLETGVFPTFHPQGIPSDVMEYVERKVNEGKGPEDRVEFLKVGRSMSGTTVIEEYAEQSKVAGQPIKPVVYTSSDSVYQVAYQIGRELGEGEGVGEGEELVIETVKELGQEVNKRYAINIREKERMFAVCAAAREALTNSLDPNHHFLRVIARPFVSRKEPLPSGEKYIRVASFRRDYVLEVPGPTLLDIAAEAGMRNLGIGKIGEIFSRRGLSVVWPLGRHLKNDTEGIELLLQALKTWQETGIIFVNLVDCDERFGHSNDFMGFARNLMMIDSRLRHIRRALRPWDILFITADHGNDPTRALTIRKNKKKNERGTDHTREFLFLAALGRLINTRTTLGKVRFADLGATAAQFLGVNFPPHGKSFLAEMLRG